SATEVDATAISDALVASYLIDRAATALGYVLCTPLDRQNIVGLMLLEKLSCSSGIQTDRRPASPTCKTRPEELSLYLVVTSRKAALLSCKSLRTCAADERPSMVLMNVLNLLSYHLAMACHTRRGLITLVRFCSSSASACSAKSALMVTSCDKSPPPFVPVPAFTFRVARTNPCKSTIART